MKHPKNKFYEWADALPWYVKPFLVAFLILVILLACVAAVPVWFYFSLFPPRFLRPVSRSAWPNLP